MDRIPASERTRERLKALMGRPWKEGKPTWQPNSLLTTCVKHLVDIESMTTLVWDIPALASALLQHIDELWLKEAAAAPVFNSGPS